MPVWRMVRMLVRAVNGVTATPAVPYGVELLVRLRATALEAGVAVAEMPARTLDAGPAAANSAALLALTRFTAVLAFVEDLGCAESRTLAELREAAQVIMDELRRMAGDDNPSRDTINERAARIHMTPTQRLIRMPDGRVVPADATEHIQHQVNQVLDQTLPSALPRSGTKAPTCQRQDDSLRDTPRPGEK